MASKLKTENFIHCTSTLWPAKYTYIYNLAHYEKRLDISNLEHTSDVIKALLFYSSLKHDIPMIQHVIYRPLKKKRS